MPRSPSTTVDPVFAEIAKAIYGDVDPRDLETVSKFHPGGSDLHSDGPMTQAQARKQKRLAVTGLATTGVAGVAGLHAISASVKEAKHQVAAAETAPGRVARVISRTGLSPRKAAIAVGAGLLGLHGVELTSDALGAHAQLKQLRQANASIPNQNVAKAFRLKPLNVLPSHVPSLRAKRVKLAPPPGNPTTKAGLYQPVSKGFRGAWRAGKATARNVKDTAARAEHASRHAEEASRHASEVAGKVNALIPSRRTAALLAGGAGAALVGGPAVGSYAGSYAGTRRGNKLVPVSKSAASRAGHIAGGVAAHVVNDPLTIPLVAIPAATAAYGYGRYHVKNRNRRKTLEPVTKSEPAEVTWTGLISKVDDDQRQVFGWASVSAINGQPVIDLQGDIVPIEEMEKSAYRYVIESRKGGDMHKRVSKADQPLHTSDMIESFVVTPEKLEKMGLAADALPHGWWVGYHINDDAQWAMVKSGERAGFSIHGKGSRMPVSKAMMTPEAATRFGHLKRLRQVSLKDAERYRKAFNPATLKEHRNLERNHEKFTSGISSRTARQKTMVRQAIQSGVTPNEIVIATGRTHNLGHGGIGRQEVRGAIPRRMVDASRADRSGPVNLPDASYHADELKRKGFAATTGIGKVLKAQSAGKTHERGSRMPISKAGEMMLHGVDYGGPGYGIGGNARDRGKGRGGAYRTTDMPGRSAWGSARGAASSAGRGFSGGARYQFGRNLFNNTAAGKNAKAANQARYESIHRQGVAQASHPRAFKAGVHAGRGLAHPVGMGASIGLAGSGLVIANVHANKVQKERIAARKAAQANMSIGKDAGDRVRDARDKAQKVLRRTGDSLKERGGQAAHPPAVKTHRVKSSPIASMGYQPQTRRLAVEMRSRPGQPYEYRMKPGAAIDALTAPSKGSHYATQIRGKAKRANGYTPADRARLFLDPVNKSYQPEGAVLMNNPYESAFGVVDYRLSKADSDYGRPSGGRQALGTLVPMFHAPIAGRKGHKLRATGNEWGGGILGGWAGGAAAAGLHKVPGAGLLPLAGSIGGGVAGTRRAQRMGHLKPQN